MTIRARLSPAVSPTPVLALAALLSLFACGEPDGVPEAEGPVVTPEDLPADVQDQALASCLDRLWEDDADDAVRIYDRQNDIIDGVSISCTMSTTATKLFDAMKAIRDAAQHRDRAAMLQAIGLPLLYIDDEGNAHQLKDQAAIEAAFEEVFTPGLIEVLTNLDPQDIKIRPDQGIFVELGTLWLVVPEGETQPRIVTIDLQALEESSQVREAATADLVPIGNRESVVGEEKESESSD